MALISAETGSATLRQTAPPLGKRAAISGEPRETANGDSGTYHASVGAPAKHWQRGGQGAPSARSRT